MFDLVVDGRLVCRLDEEQRAELASAQRLRGIAMIPTEDNALPVCGPQLPLFDAQMELF